MSGKIIGVTVGTSLNPERIVERIGQETDPTVPDWAKEPNRPVYTASDVGADIKGTAESVVSAHNTSLDTHNDIRDLIETLGNRLDNLDNGGGDSTEPKVNVSDIINNLTTDVSDKPLSAAMGVALKALIDAISVPTALSQLSQDETHRVVTDTEKSTWNAKSDFRYKRVLTSADDLNNLKEEGVYRYSTSSVPANCPYANAGVVEVIYVEGVSGTIQRVTRYGMAGCSATRILYNSGWLEWSYAPLVFKKTYSSKTNANGNAYTSIDDAYYIVHISAQDANGNETYICTPYKSKEYSGSWYVNVTTVSDKTNIASTNFTFTILYAVL